MHHHYVGQYAGNEPTGKRSLAEQLLDLQEECHISDRMKREREYEQQGEEEFEESDEDDDDDERAEQPRTPVLEPGGAAGPHRGGQEEEVYTPQERCVRTSRKERESVKQPTWTICDIESGAGGLTRKVETPSPSNSPHGPYVILRVELVGSHGRWKRPRLQTTPMQPDDAIPVEFHTVQ
jgi:hypothetical protein